MAVTSGAQGIAALRELGVRKRRGTDAPELGRHDSNQPIQRALHSLPAAGAVPHADAEGLLDLGTEAVVAQRGAGL